MHQPTGRPSANSGNVSRFRFPSCSLARLRSYLTHAGFDMHSDVGGACGEICVDAGKGCFSSRCSPPRRTSNTRCPISSTSRSRASSATSQAYPARSLPAAIAPSSTARVPSMHCDGVSSAGFFERDMYLAEDRMYVAFGM